VLGLPPSRLTGADPRVSPPAGLTPRRLVRPLCGSMDLPQPLPLPPYLLDARLPDEGAAARPVAELPDESIYIIGDGDGNRNRYVAKPICVHRNT
jgi:hypothetical protein